MANKFTPMTDASKQMLLGAMTEVVDHVSKGMVPNGAIVKVASDRQLSLPFVRLLVGAFNASRTRAQLSVPDVEKRAGAFELADYSEVVASLYPAVHKEEQHKQEARAAEAEKHATSLDAALVNSREHFHSSFAPVSEERSLVMKVASIRARAKDLMAEVKAARHDAVAAKFAAIDEAGKAAAYFDAHPDQFEPAERAVTAKFGFIGTKAATAVAGCMGEVTSGQIKRAGACRSGDRSINIDRSPFSHIGKVACALAKYAAANLKADRAEQALPEFREAYVSLEQETKAADEDHTSLFKAGQAGTGTVIGLRALAQALPGAHAAEKKYLLSLFKPEVRDTMRMAQTKAILTHLMSSDPVISGYDPDEVAQAYNAIATIAPLASTNEPLMTDLLRRKLQGEVLAPHELKQIAEITAPSPAKQQLQKLINVGREKEPA